MVSRLNDDDRRGWDRDHDRYRDRDRDDRDGIVTEIATATINRDRNTSKLVCLL